MPNIDDVRYQGNGGAEGEVSASANCLRRGGCLKWRVPYQRFIRLTLERFRLTVDAVEKFPQRRSLAVFKLRLVHGNGYN